MSEPPIPITRVIRHKLNGSWLTHEGQWTRDFCDARPFNSITEAIQAAQTHRLKEAQFVIRFLNEPYWDIATDL